MLDMYGSVPVSGWVCFELTARMNGSVAATYEPQAVHATMDLVHGSGSSLATRDVVFVIPPLICDHGPCD